MRTTVALVGLAILATVGVAFVGTVVIADDDEDETMGAEVSAFAQSGAADAPDTVEDGMFDAAYENATEEDRATVVENQTAALEERIANIEAEKAALEEDDDLPEPAQEARMSALATQLDNLNSSLQVTEERAVETGVDTSALEELRTNASELDGPEVAAIAQDLAGVSSNGQPDDGPPDDGGPPGADD